MNRTMYALLTTRGTAAHETALCNHCYLEPQVRQRYSAAAFPDVASTEYTDCSGNEALVCVHCGEDSSQPSGPQHM
jgi:hypothetical protein